MLRLLYNGCDTKHTFAGEGGGYNLFSVNLFFIFADGSINREKTHLQIFRQNFLFVFYNAQRDWREFCMSFDLCEEICQNIFLFSFQKNTHMIEGKCLVSWFVFSSRIYSWMALDWVDDLVYYGRLPDL